jgi:selenocysteine-specific elongation factor
VTVDDGMRVIATAGHVDHGKSTLVRALTGTDPDRLPDEKARGLTIDLGFAFTTLPSGCRLGFVDVPGHVRFVKNMLAGVGAVQVALFVVAADDGWSEQSAEHAAILDLLDVRQGVVAITKADAVDAERVEIVTRDVAERLADTTAANWPIVVTDGVSGRGLDTLRNTIDELMIAAPPPIDTGRPRLWIDRVFRVRGAGTVVTGTLAGGQLQRDEQVVVEPGGRRARIRRLESAGEERDVAAPGSRVAVNLVGIEASALRRGDAVVSPGQWLTPRVVDVEVRMVNGGRTPDRTQVTVHVGSGEYEVTLRPLEPAGPHARLTLPVGLPLAPGDRFVLRSSARQTTIGGGVVLDVAPARRAADARIRLRRSTAQRALDARPWSTAEELGPLTGRSDTEALARELCERGDAVTIDGRLVPRATVGELRAAVHGAVTAAPEGVELAPLAERLHVDVVHLRGAIADDSQVHVDHGVVRLASAGHLIDDPAARALIDALNERPFTPPALSELAAPPPVVRALLRADVLVDIDGLVFTRAAYDAACDRVAGAIARQGSVTIADVRALLDSSRKYVVPLLQRMDADGVTRRRGDTRFAGARVGSR